MKLRAYRVRATPREYLAELREEVVALLYAHTLCELGHHCAPAKRIQKFDGGKLPQLCCYCRLIVAWGPKGN